MGLKQKILKKLLVKRAKRISDFILPYIKDSDRVLDFGCGNMLVSEHLSGSLNVNITGIDVVDYNLGNLDFIKFEGGALPFKDNEFDVAFSAFSLHHTSDPEFYLKELRRISRNKVIILEDVYNTKFQKFITSVFDWIGNHLESWHVDIPFNLLSLKGWMDLIESYCLKLTNIERVYPYPVPFIPIKNIIMVLEK